MVPSLIDEDYSKILEVLPPSNGYNLLCKFHCISRDFDLILFEELDCLGSIYSQVLTASVLPSYNAEWQTDLIEEFFSGGICHEEIANKLMDVGVINLDASPKTIARFAYKDFEFTWKDGSSKSLSQKGLSYNESR